ncbi:FMN-binding protein [Pelagicoccus sp. SDUM812003]|uniref:FMN-binding protein n=1 Tax=Pelagicoccus sp. SDUM812003 TaxID=3041267 RepID=UPI00280E21C2|nr:FMN-binding protein [Pelagicoccus sp. SDUM812003]MDQ8205235.1 FMN-binding protein [Pelagicoccus sp. SDUM812003]
MVRLPGLFAIQGLLPVSLQPFFLDHMPIRLATCLCLTLICMLAAPSIEATDEVAEETYLAPDQFLADTFDQAPPKPQVLWLTKSLKPRIREILGHDYPAVRIRYWRQENRTAWILEEIGKTQPITVGIAVEDEQIARLKVLVYRESHGWEVKYPFFTDQFQDASLEDDMELSKNIDGIAGATLSVNALERLSRLALYFHQQTNPPPPEA